MSIPTIFCVRSRACACPPISTDPATRSAWSLYSSTGYALARFHAVAEEGVPLREIAEVIGRRLKVPTRSITTNDAAAHFGWLAAFAGLDARASSELTRKRLAWQPTGPGLISDLERLEGFET